MVIAVTNNSESQVDTAHPVEINQALLADESIDVIHPVADVDFSLNNTLKDQKAIDENNIWPRIRQPINFRYSKSKASYCSEKLVCKTSKLP